jgi:hypothetical protein
MHLISLKRILNIMPKRDKLLQEVLNKIYRTGVGIALSGWSRRPIGIHVFDQEWYLLVLLDTCRVDALQSVGREYEFIHDVDHLLSVGSTSSEWIAQTFTRDRVSQEQVGYVSGNAWAEWVIEDRQMPEEDKDALFSFTDWDVAHKSDFAVLDQAWRYNDEDKFDLPPGLPHPRIVTDHAIHVDRTYELDRLIVHYSQPHAPYTAPALNENRDMRPHESDPFEYLKSGGSHNRVWKAYLENLRFVLEEVNLLLNNIDAERVAISADHGESFGEWGVYGHPAALPHPTIKRVPWVETSATDMSTYEVDIKEDIKTGSASEQLKALGYL